MEKQVAFIDINKCIGCGACIEQCPMKGIKMQVGWHSKVDSEKCIACGNCVEICHRHAASLIVIHS
ncbi:MAG: 4Fe-4S binding protein [Clostridiales bacterium]|nr:4Fe-4S binding protein [Clostridiales bacterium]